MKRRFIRMNRLRKGFAILFAVEAIMFPIMSVAFDKRASLVFTIFDSLICIVAILYIVFYENIHRFTRSIKAILLEAQYDIRLSDDFLEPDNMAWIVHYAWCGIAAFLTTYMGIYYLLAKYT